MLDIKLSNIGAHGYINAIWHKTMTTFFERSRREQKGGDLADVPNDKFLARQMNSQRYKVYPSDDNTFQIEKSSTGDRYTVLLQERACGCTCFEEYNSPCAHGIAAIRFKKLNPFDFFDKCYLLRRYRSTFATALPPISIPGLKPDGKTLPPIVHKKRGRPPVKRIRKSQLWRKTKAPRSCGNCGERGHDRRKCYGQPLESGKEQRARDRAAAAAESDSDINDARAKLEATDSDFASSGLSDLPSGSDNEVLDPFQHFIDEARVRATSHKAGEAEEMAAIDAQLAVDGAFGASTRAVYSGTKESIQNRAVIASVASTAVKLLHLLRLYSKR